MSDQTYPRESKAIREQGPSSAASHEALLECAVDCIIIADHQGTILEFNPAAERTFGFKRAEVIGKELGDTIIPPAFRAAHRQGMARYLASGEAHVLGRARGNP